jgi:hypothetical protein
MVNATPWPLYPRERDPVLILQEAGSASGAVWTVCKKLAYIGCESPEHPVRSEFLYQLSYRSPRKNDDYQNLFTMKIS